VTTALAIVLTAVAAYLVGKRHGYRLALSYVAALFPSQDVPAWVESQRQNAELQ